MFEKITDKGHRNLERDTAELVELVSNFAKNVENAQYHDFANTNFAFPKRALNESLATIERKIAALRYNNKNGRYDNA